MQFTLAYSLCMIPDPPAFTSYLLRLQVFVTTPGLMGYCGSNQGAKPLFFFKNCILNLVSLRKFLLQFGKNRFLKEINFT